MLVRCRFFLATFVPRSVWDPAHANTNWTDSYATDIAARRQWPAKRWSVGLEPRTPSDWLQFSYRNLAYAYNGALRACASFPEMLSYYKEMKVRGVKVDVDTMSVMLSRAARYEHTEVDDIFLLFEEMVGLGARPDLSVVEILHTVLEHSVSMPAEWREARRRQLVDLYNLLLTEEIERLAPHHVGDLLAAQVQRVRDNLRQLSSSISPAVYRRYLAVIDSGDRLLREVHNFLWEFVQPDHPATELPVLQMRIPFVASVMRRPKLTGQLSSSSPSSTLTAEADVASAATDDVRCTDFEDSDVCSVFLAAIGRCVDGELYDKQHQLYSERRLYLSLLTMLTSTGVLYTRELMAQLMDVVKFSRDDASRDSDAMRLLRYALRGSSSTAPGDNAYRVMWNRIAPAVDARVLGRYLASRNPWSGVRLCCDAQLHFGTYPVPQLLTRSGAAAREAGGSSGGGTDSNASDELSTSSSDHDASRSSAMELRTANALRLRWDDAKQLIERTGVLRCRRICTSPTRAVAPAAGCSNDDNDEEALQAAMEVFTGMAVFLRTAATARRYGSLDEAFATQAVGDAVCASSAGVDGVSSSSCVGGVTDDLFAAGYSLDVWQLLLSCVQELRSMLEHYLERHGAGRVVPELECWEAMVLTLRCVLDYAVVRRQEWRKGDEAAAIDALFRDAAQLRAQLVEETRTRFDGRMRVLWLHEA